MLGRNYDASTSQANGAVSIEPNKSEVDTAGYKIDAEIDNCITLIETLGARLYPVLKDLPCNECLSKSQNDEMYSPLGKGLLITSLRIGDINQRIKTLIDRLSI